MRTRRKVAYWLTLALLAVAAAHQLGYDWGMDRGQQSVCSAHTQVMR